MLFSRLNDKCKFVFEIIKHPRATGALCQSSKMLAQKMTDKIGSSKNIIEFGPGTGIITKEILNNLKPKAKLTSFEINPVFCQHLKTLNDPRLTVINDDAQNCRNYITDYDCIISGLPLTVFTKAQRENILKITSKAEKYIQFQYTPFLRKKFSNHFDEVKITLVTNNIPPAFIYLCTNLN